MEVSDSAIPLQGMVFEESPSLYQPDLNQYPMAQDGSESCYNPFLLNLETFSLYSLFSSGLSPLFGSNSAGNVDESHHSNIIADGLSNVYDHDNLAQSSSSPSTYSPSSSTSETTPNEVDAHASIGPKEGANIKFRNANQLTVKNSKKVFCETCGEQFDGAKALAEHERRKPKHFKCELCPREFPKLNDLRRHRRSHDGPFSCVHCQKTFEKRSALTHHQQIHNPDREVVICSRENCHKVYQRLADYNRHVESVHGTKTFTCRYCNKKTFTRFDTKLRHENQYCTRSERTQILKAEKTLSAMRKKGMQIWFDTNALTQTTEQQQEEPFQSIPEPAEAEAESAYQDLQPLAPTLIDTVNTFQSDTIMDVIQEEDYPLHDLDSLERYYSMSYIYDVEANTYPAYAAAPQRIGLGIQNASFHDSDAIDMGGPTTAYDAQMNFQASQVLLDHHYLYNAPYANSFADVGEGTLEMTMMMDLQPIAPVDLDFMGVSDLDPNLDWTWLAPFDAAMGI